MSVIWSFLFHDIKHFQANIRSGTVDDQRRKKIETHSWWNEYICDTFATRGLRSWQTPIHDCVDGSFDLINVTLSYYTTVLLLFFSIISTRVPFNSVSSVIESISSTPPYFHAEPNLALHKTQGFSLLSPVPLAKSTTYIDVCVRYQLGSPSLGDTENSEAKKRRAHKWLSCTMMEYRSCPLHSWRC